MGLPLFAPVPFLEGILLSRAGGAGVFSIVFVPCDISTAWEQREWDHRLTPPEMFLEVLPTG